MKSMSALKAKTHFGQILKQVANGEQVLITEDDKPIARVIPEYDVDLARVRKATAGLRALQRQIGKRIAGQPKLSDEEVRSAIEEGRR